MMAELDCKQDDFNASLTKFCADSLLPIISNNIDYFLPIKYEYWYADKFLFILQKMVEDIHWFELNLNSLILNLPLYDYNENTPGNGYRSFALIIVRCFNECYKFCKDLCCARKSIFFRPEKYLCNLENHVSVLEGLKSGLKYITKMLSKCSDQLLSLDVSLTADELIRDYGLVNQIGFYGSCQGFYYCQSMRKTLRGVSCIMASFSDLYRKGGQPLSRAIASVVNVAKYFLNPELRSQQIVNVAQNSSVEFLKAFWSLNETDFMKKLPRWICQKLDVEMELFVPDKAIELPNIDFNDSVIIPVPSSHAPSSPVRCLLLSSHCHQGQMQLEGSGKRCCTAIVPPSPALLIHCHGGGFISQSPESHEIYLRNWAHELKVPILSIDYSLAPAAAFPRALEEVLLVYAWCLKNFKKLGCTGERVCFVGDSAGGNLLMGTVLKTIALGIRRPDAILCAYSPLILDMVPSPSRLLCWLDPLLPLGFMLSCLGAYAGIAHMTENEYMEESSPLKSPIERKVSSISEIFDSSLHFLKENEWLEVEANEPDATNSSKMFDLSTKLYKGHEFQYRSDHEMFHHHSFAVPPDDYVSCFLKEHDIPSNNKYKQTRFVDDSDHLLFNFPQDAIFCAKRKCYNFVLKTFGNATNFIGQNKMINECISPLLKLLPINPFAETQMCSSTFKESKWAIFQKIKTLKLKTRDPFMSPLLASDDFLRDMPSVYFVSLNFDPCLDDSITFCKRLSAVNKHVVLDVLDGLPHGFLNFLPFSQEAHDGSDLCIRRLKEALQL